MEKKFSWFGIDFGTTNSAAFSFTGNDNLLNAIYSQSNVNFNNVSYWGVDGIMNTGTSSITRSEKEKGQNITIIFNNNGDIEEYTKVTDTNGEIKLDYSNYKKISGKYEISAYHAEDSYYTSTDVKTLTFTVPYSITVLENKTISAEKNVATTLNATINNINSSIIIPTSNTKLRFINP